MNVGVDIFPSETSVRIPGERIYFTCTDLSGTALSVQWLVNGTRLENSGLVIAYQTYDRRSKVVIYSLTSPWSTMSPLSSAFPPSNSH